MLAAALAHGSGTRIAVLRLLIRPVAKECPLYSQLVRRDCLDLESDRESLVQVMALVNVDMAILRWQAEASPGLPGNFLHIGELDLVQVRFPNISDSSLQASVRINVQLSTAIKDNVDVIAVKSQVLGLVAKAIRGGFVGPIVLSPGENDLVVGGALRRRFLRCRALRRGLSRNRPGCPGQQE